jgi:hypothetical protein
LTDRNILIFSSIDNSPVNCIVSIRWLLMKMKSIRECELTQPNVKHLLFGLRALQTSIKSFLSIYFFNSVEPMSSHVNIYNVYVPNLGNDKKIFINQSISMNPVDKNIVLGDFNCTLLKSLDRKPIPNRDDIGSTELHSVFCRLLYH